MPGAEIPNCCVHGAPRDTALRPDRPGRVSVDGVFERRPVDPRAVKTHRPDVFQPGHFSVFDAVVQACGSAGVPVEHHFDERLETHVIDSLDGRPHWWYGAGYHPSHHGEEPAHRMDVLPYRDWMAVFAYPVEPERTAELRGASRAEAQRFEANGGRCVVPDVTIRTDTLNVRATDVEVEPHGLRGDLFQPGVTTVADVMLSLAERGDTTLDLEWVELVGGTLVQSYHFTRFGDRSASGLAGYFYESGERALAPPHEPRFHNNRVHVMSDVRVVLSPEYVHWEWHDLSHGRH